MCRRKSKFRSSFKDSLIENSRILGHLLQETEPNTKFSDHLAYIQGRGLLAAAIFMVKMETLSSLCDRISELCLQQGLLVVHTGRESIKFGPPLMIDEEALLEGLDVFENAVAAAIGEV